MNYYRDYHTLFRPNAAEVDFQARLLGFLGELGLPDAAAKDISSRTSASMNGLKYHSHAHILSIFDWAKEENITLEPWQTLAIWFHDVIYELKVAALQNEEQSAQFAERFLSEHLPAEMLARTCEAIRHTARHLEPADFAFPEGVPVVLDLDLCMFAWDRQNYAAAARFVAEEYQTIYSSREYANGRKSFLTQFMGKGFIYRTPAMQRYEAVAMDNIQWEIANVGYARMVNHALRAMLADLPVGADISASEPFRSFLHGLEFFVPEVLSEGFPEWRRESLDGFYPLMARKTGQGECELFGLCILISDQTTTPIHLRMQAAPFGEEVQWLECKLGERRGDGMARDNILPITATQQRVRALGGRAEAIDWVYRITFGQRNTPKS